MIFSIVVLVNERLDLQLCKKSVFGISGIFNLSYYLSTVLKVMTFSC